MFRQVIRCVTTLPPLSQNRMLLKERIGRAVTSLGHKHNGSSWTQQPHYEFLGSCSKPSGALVLPRIVRKLLHSRSCAYTSQQLSNSSYLGLVGQFERSTPDVGQIKWRPTVPLPPEELYSQFRVFYAGELVWAPEWRDMAVEWVYSAPSMS